MKNYSRISISKPWAIALLSAAILAFVSSWFIFPHFETYKLDLLAKTKYNYSDSKGMFYVDLDQDGNSEQAYIFNNADISTASIMISLAGGNAHLEQYNFEGRWLSNSFLNTGDYDSNGFSELYLFTQKKDSLFLHIKEPFAPKGINVPKIFIGKTQANKQEEYHIRFGGAKLIDSNQDGFKDLHFFISAGFSLQPRKYYVYDIKSNQLKQSPLSASIPFTGLFFKDIKGDGSHEACGQINANFNYHSPIPYPDSSSWIMVFTSDAEFLFPPIEMPGAYGRTVSTFVNIKQKNRILSLHQSANANKSRLQSTFYLVDEKGNVLQKKAIDFPDTLMYYSFVQHPDYPNPVLLSRKGDFLGFDDNLKLFPIGKALFEFKEEQGIMNSLIDVNGDKEKEWFFKSNMGATYLVSKDLKHSLKIETNSKDNIPITLRKVGGKTVSFGVPTFENFLEYSYSKTPYPWIKYLLVLLVFLASALFLHLLLKMQKRVLEKRYAEEKKIQKYQYQGLRNQLDPHFSLNILNAIQSLFFQKDFDKAKQLLSRYGKLNRSALQNAEKIAISLEDELDFVEHFLALEKFRFEERFDYFIKVDKMIDTELIMLPRMLIHTFAENAIKHGLFPKEEAGLLKIEVKENEKEIQIIIEDNGIGRAKSKELKTTNHGKGLSIIQEIVKLYNKLNSTEINYTTIDLCEGNVSEGTRVEVIIPNK